MLRGLRGELELLIARDYRGEQNNVYLTYYPHTSLTNHCLFISVARGIFRRVFELLDTTEADIDEGTRHGA